MLSRPVPGEPSTTPWWRALRTLWVITATTPSQTRSSRAAPEAIREAIRGYGDVGVDEINFWPTIADTDQVHRLADIVGSEELS